MATCYPRSCIHSYSHQTVVNNVKYAFNVVMSQTLHNSVKWEAKITPKYYILLFNHTL